jgi:hypothetical protein
VFGNDCRRDENRHIEQLAAKGVELHRAHNTALKN